jgi:uncharacterized membrane protein
LFLRAHYKNIKHIVEISTIATSANKFNLFIWQIKCGKLMAIKNIELNTIITWLSLSLVELKVKLPCAQLLKHHAMMTYGGIEA